MSPWRYKHLVERDQSRIHWPFYVRKNGLSLRDARGSAQRQTAAEAPPTRGVSQSDFVTGDSTGRSAADGGAAYGRSVAECASRFDQL